MLKEYLKVMKALSDGNRTKIVKMLALKEMCVCEMQAALKMAQPSVSKHLKILEDAELIDSWKEGSWVIYRIAADSDNPYAEVLSFHLKDWLFENPEIRKIYRQAQVSDKQRECAA